jgi:site-specific DNA-methyltransferase (adenine-specific)
MITKQIAIAQLSLDPSNARKHSQRNLEAIAASLSKFGQRKPIVVHRGVVLAGNGTLEAAKTLGWSDIAITEVPNDWDLDTAKAYALADNRTAELAEWDESELAKQLLDLQEKDWDITELGFEVPQLNDIEPTDEDEIPEPPVEPITKLGDIWQLGKHKLMCGDSTDEATVLRLMDGAKADMVFTDPPYGMAYEGGRGTQEFGQIANDALEGKALINLISTALKNCFKASNPNAANYICFTWRTYNEFKQGIEQASLEIKSCIVWDKGSIGLSHGNYRPQHEFIFYVQGEWYGDRAQSDVWQVNRDAQAGYVHPTQKPVNLIVKALQNSSLTNNTIVDPFGGSGSTLIAAEQTNRKAHLMELDPKYCDVIVKRWENLTGEKATLVNGNQSHHA